MALSIPTGLVSFLFTDVEGSTRLWEDDAEAMSASLGLHDRILRRGVSAHDGYVFSTAGDAFAGAFPSPTGAIDAALEISFACSARSGPDLPSRCGWGSTRAPPTNGTGTTSARP